MYKPINSKNKIKLFYGIHKKKISIILRIIISFGLITFLIKTQFKGLTSTINILKSASIPLILLSASTHIFGVWITAVRWKVLLKTQNINLSTGYLTSSVLIGFFLNNFLPTTIGGDAFRAYDISKKASVPLSTSFSVIIVERFSGVISAATFAVIALFLGFTTIGNQSIIIPIIIFFVICLILAFLILNPSILRLNKIVNKIGFLSKMRGKLANVYHTFISFKKYKLALMQALIFSFSLQFAVILNYFLAAKSLDINLGLTAFIFIVPVVATIAMLPISLGGIGIRENSLVFIMVSLGVVIEKAALCSLLLFSMLIIIGIIGGIIYTVRPFFSRKIEHTKMKINKQL